MIGHLDAITLAELMATAELQTRVDRKYVLPLTALDGLITRLDPRSRVLEIDGRRTFRYRSVYFDTADLISFRQTVHRRRRRFKVRTRTYVDSALCWLEVKTEGQRGGTVKDRLPYAESDHRTVEPGRPFLDNVLGDRSAPDLAPTLVTSYRRTTVHQPAGNSRVTIDIDLSWTDAEGRTLHLPHLAVVETKTSAAASPADRLLWAGGYRPTALSKYATGLAALRPDLPSAPWRRTLRRHFTV
ncbi:polyphosphate polymerase domain-containing protein [Actinoplanes sp. LDG1-06]|uniref:Polyphosphate polymerase domain-containing protein n=1 Tax=Paractinoplanes ovalisporus TaxID=2810368 RepID=A0ABS2A2A7_9ACTN|nr:polyphosphate polymerase domain-containing protein [Actinoplanes ovalisporus]MBM2613975.1 polyphosphate polymerase domain-containing protein [Actinoplanes ovalisporus]